MIVLATPYKDSAQYMPDGDLLIDVAELGCEFLDQLPNCDHTYDYVMQFIHRMFEFGWCRVAIDPEHNMSVGMWLSSLATNPFNGDPVMLESAWYVDEGYRNQGVGKMLLDAALAHAADIGAKIHMSTVGATSTKTERQLEALGFVRGETIWRM